MHHKGICILVPSGIVIMCLWLDIPKFHGREASANPVVHLELDWVIIAAGM